MPPQAPAWNACGYAAVRDAVASGASMDAARDAVIISTRQYAKRQRTWIRHQLGEADVTRVDPDAADAIMRIEAWWEGASVDDFDGGAEVKR